MAEVLEWSRDLAAEIFQCAKAAQQDAGDASYVVYAILDLKRPGFPGGIFN